jgi:hypothetical protein
MQRHGKTMKKIAFLAATALAMTSTMASAQAIEIGRQTLLDNGSAPSNLRLALKGAVTANGTHTLVCVLNQPNFVAASGSSDFAALNVTSIITTTSGTPIGGKEIELAYTGRINPKGMAVGDAVYTGSFTPITSSTQELSNLSCPEERTVHVGYRAAVAGDPGQEAVQAVDGKEAIYDTMPEPVCKAAALADNGQGTNVLKVGDCPKVPDYGKLLFAAVEPVEGQAYRPSTLGTPEVPDQAVTISYTPAYSFQQSGLVLQVDGQTFSY